MPDASPLPDMALLNQSSGSEEVVISVSPSIVYNAEVRYQLLAQRNNFVDLDLLNDGERLFVQNARDKKRKREDTSSEADATEEDEEEGEEEEEEEDDEEVKQETKRMKGKKGKEGNRSGTKVLFPPAFSPLSPFS